MVQLIGSGLSFVIVLAVVARGCLLFGSLPNDAELVVGMLNNLLKSLLKIHRYLLRWSVVSSVEGEMPAVPQLDLHRGPVRLHGAIVVAVAHRADGAPT